MPSQLTFDATESFRKKLLLKNLPPYSEGFKPDSKPGETEFNVNDFAIIDPGNIENIGNIQEQKLYTKNKYGPENVNGFGDVKDINLDKNTESNQGEYEYSSSEPSMNDDGSRLRALIKNQYAPEEGYGEKINIKDVEKLIEKRDTYYKFIFSTYSPFNILTELIPTGSNGSLSQDSDLAKIAAESLKESFESRIALETYQQTIGRVNALDALSDPFDALAIVTGNRSVIEKDYHISVPDNIVGKGLDFISRITGVYSPYSWIQGDYFAPELKQTSEEQASVGGLFERRDKLKTESNKRASDLMLKSTGKGQSGRLFSNLSFNKFRPDYQDVNDKSPLGSYYLGSKILSVQDILSPPEQLPVDNNGNKVKIPVRGYSELGKLYENKDASNNFKFGLNGNKFLPGTNVFTNSSYDSKRLQGGFIWSTEESSDFAKKGVARGGDVVGGGEFIENGYDSTPKSNDYTFTQGSILDNTQKIIEAANGLGGDAKLQHVGNAINQISKVFNDGTREMTKGSMVYKYEDTETGQIVGTEYCRVFNKDKTYSHNRNLQKDKGAVDDYRKFKGSVLNNTYNLNIAPWRNNNNDSSNIQEGKVKKYMFSIENLAWRTSNKKGFTYQDLPVCERGPNGGRIMWFPPYDLKVNENNSVNWTSNEFLGRPEPIFTYNNTTRQGGLSWKIVVDHPSILNVMVDKELKRRTKEEVNDIVDSFFAGCRDYDMYELATRFPQFSPNDIYEIIQNTETIEGTYQILTEIEKVEIRETAPIIEEYAPKVEPQDYSYFFYFDNDVPGPKSASQPIPEGTYESHLETYKNSLDRYLERAKPEYSQQVLFFFLEYIYAIETKTRELATKIKKALDEGATINVVMYGSASAPNSVSYNATLSQRRLKSVEDYFYTFIDREKYQDKFTITFSPQGEQANVYTPDGNGPFDCTQDFEDSTDSVYSPIAMACRRVRINVEEIAPDPEQKEPPAPTYEEIITKETIESLGYTSRTETTTSIDTNEDVAKIILRKLLNECDYFDMMKEDSPMVYQGIQDKLKFFQPVFHSITPEGLNSRLTFLQQCIRPGDTIPVIGEDGKPKEGDIKNTAFGAPPICVLRIGDFYHTKIAINQLSISYEPLVFDLNPEGIGVQPMLADINISFYFIGGQGLEAPVARLQNALSFNYYGNTEMYDERAIPTEDRTEINNETLRRIEDIQGFSVVDGNVERPEEAGDTIGEILTSDFIGETLTGQTKYKAIMDELTSKSQTYVQNIITTIETMTSEQSIIALYYFTKFRKYFIGQITGYFDGNNSLEMNIFGKPENIQQQVDVLYSDLSNDIINNTNPFLSKISLENFKNSEISKFKKNLQTFLDYTKTYFNANFNSLMGDLIKNQTEMIRVVDKMNLILTNTDGFRNKSGGNILFDLSGTTEVDVSSSQSNTFDELLADTQTVGYDLQYFYNKIFGPDDSTLVNSLKENFYEGFLTGVFDTQSQTRFCTVAYPFMMEDPEFLKDMILGEQLKTKTEWVNYVNKIIYGTPEIPININQIMGSETNTTQTIGPNSGLLDVYKKLRKDTATKVNNFKNSNDVKKFNIYEPFNPDKERVFNYVQETQSTFDSIKNDYFNKVYEGINGGDLNKFNQKYTFN